MQASARFSCKKICFCIVIFAYFKKLLYLCTQNRANREFMKKLLIFLFLSAAMSAFSQNTEPAKDDYIIDGLTSVATIAGETKNTEEPQDTATAAATPQAEIPLWKQKLYYGYNFDIYFHSDSKKDSRENGWSFALTPEIGWKLTEKIYLGMRFGGSYANYKSSYLGQGGHLAGGTPLCRHGLPPRDGRQDCAHRLRRIALCHHVRVPGLAGNHLSVQPKEYLPDILLHPLAGLQRYHVQL